MPQKKTLINDALPGSQTQSQSGDGTGDWLLEIYRRLYQAYGPQGWWPGDGPLDVVVGAILTQSAAWTNVEKAIANLKMANCWSLDALHRRSQEDLAEIIHPSGYFNAKARKLKAFALHVTENYNGNLGNFLSKPLDPLREELLSIHGIGPETADDILVYAAGQPSFVIDSYTRRIVRRLGSGGEVLPDNYHAYQGWFHENLPRETPLFNEFHALLDRHAKDPCAKTPSCQGCCLQELCATGRDLPAQG